jgi:hypothetical protein
MPREDKLRRLIAQEAARIMYEEGIREYRNEPLAIRCEGSSSPDLPASAGTFTPVEAAPPPR